MQRGAGIEHPDLHIHSAAAPSGVARSYDNPTSMTSLRLLSTAVIACAVVWAASSASAQSAGSKQESFRRLAERVTEANVRAELFALAADSMEGRFTAS